MVDKFPKSTIIFGFLHYPFSSPNACFNFYIFIKAAKRKCNSCFRQIIYHQSCVVFSFNCLLFFAVDRRRCLTVAKKLQKFLKTVKTVFLVMDGEVVNMDAIYCLFLLIFHAACWGILHTTVLKLFVYEERHIWHLINCIICLTVHRLVACFCVCNVRCWEMSLCADRKEPFWTDFITGCLWCFGFLTAFWGLLLGLFILLALPWLMINNKQNPGLCSNCDLQCVSYRQPRDYWVHKLLSFTFFSSLAVFVMGCQK